MVYEYLQEKRQQMRLQLRDIQLKYRKFDPLIIYYKPNRKKQLLMVFH
jgi:hypothetical protein